MRLGHPTSNNRVISARDVQSTVQRFLPKDRRVELIVLPEAKESRQ